MPDKNKKSIQGLERDVLELTTLYEISRNLGDPIDLEERMHRVLDILHKKMGMERGTITLLDSESQDINIEIAHGLDPNAIKRGRYRVGEGIIGRVVEAGEPIVVPNVGKEPLFLNRTKSRGDIGRNKISFLCVPIKLNSKTIGAFSVDRLFEGDISFKEDIRLLTIISSMISQMMRSYQKREKEKQKLEKENIELKRELAKKFRPKNIIGESKRMEDVYSAIEMVSKSRATVMLRGETGTGKEMVAHAIHYESDRAEGPFIKISCAALPETLLESELFGYEKGAFTGASTGKPGRFEMAHKGTLFLDEIGDISASTQIKLLRVLQEREFERVGGRETIRTDIRLITATNRNLEKEVKEGRFREDLYYRLNVIPIFLPSLRERREDIPLLVTHFLNKSNKENGKKIKYISEKAMEYLMEYVWPGNIRELKNVIERAVILCKKETIDFDILPIPGFGSIPSLSNFTSLSDVVSRETEEGDVRSDSLPGAIEQIERKMIEKVLNRSGGNQRKAAKLLGITDRILGYKIKMLNIK